MTNRKRVLIGAAALVTAFGFPLAEAGAQEPPVQPLLDRYCLTCHTDSEHRAGRVPISLEALDPVDVPAHAESWEKVVAKLRSGMMPPAGRPRPDAATYDAVAGWLEAELDRAAAADPNPGRTTVHRLNRVEYSNAVRDLLALEVDPEALLPPDDEDEGFENIADVLSVSPTLMERYLAAARRISQLALGDPALRPRYETYRLPDRQLQDGRTTDDLPFGTRGGTSLRHYFPLDGEYTIKIGLRRNFYNYIRGIGNVPHQLDVRLDGKRVATYTAGGGLSDDAAKCVASFCGSSGMGSPEWEWYANRLDDDFEVRLDVKAGMRRVGVAFVAPAGAAGRHPAAAGGHVDVRLQPPTRKWTATRPWATWSSAGRSTGGRRQRPPAATGFSSARRPPARTRTVVRGASSAPWRGAPSAGRSQRTTWIPCSGSTGRGGPRAASTPASRRSWSGCWSIRSSSSASRCRRRLRIRPSTASATWNWPRACRSSCGAAFPTTSCWRRPKPAGCRIRPGWSSRCAACWPIRARTRWWTTSPTAGWSCTRSATSRPTRPIFAAFDENLRAAMQQETRMFLTSQVREDRSVVDLLRADYTFLNERLAQHYDIPGIYGNHFRRVTLPDGRRAGLIGKAGILTLTSYSNRTSVVTRGKWMLERVLGSPPPPPPPDVPALPESGHDGAPPTSQRELLEVHRRNPACAVCHRPMDPLWVRAGELRRHRTLAHRGRRADSRGPGAGHRRHRRDAGRRPLRGAGRTAAASARPAAGVRPHGHRAPAHVRARPAPGVL